MKQLLFTILVALFAAAAAFPQNDIRKVDFKNFTYEPEWCGNEDRQKITVSDGQFSEEKEVDGYTDRTYFSVFGITYGDVDGDTQEDAVILSVCNTGGTGNFTEAYIYSMRDGSPRLLLTIEGGDRAFGGLREITVEKGTLVVESNDAGDFGGACCPEIIVTRTYKLKGGTLEETGPPKKRDIYPAERINFAKGSSSATIEIELDDDPGIRRFVVGAAEGQRLTASADSESVRFRLVRGEAEVEEESKTLSAELLEKGDFVIEVRNFGEGKLKTNITVTIK